MKKEELGDFGCPICFQVRIFIAVLFSKTALKSLERVENSDLNFQSKYALTKLIYFIFGGIFLIRF